MPAPEAANTDYRFKAASPPTPARRTIEGCLVRRPVFASSAINACARSQARKPLGCIDIQPHRREERIPNRARLCVFLPRLWRVPTVRDVATLHTDRSNHRRGD